MIQIMEGLPEKVLGVRLSGVVKGEDYDNVLAPAIEEKVQKHEKVRLLYQLEPDFEKFSRGAMLEDMKLGFHNFTSFERIAVVLDVDWAIDAVGLFKHIIPGSVRTYSNSELSEAREWISS